MGPMGIGPKNHKITRLNKNTENDMFLSTWKRCASEFCEGSTDLELQIIDMELLGANSVQIGYDTFPNELVWFHIEAKPIWKNIQQHWKNAVIC